MNAFGRARELRWRIGQLEDPADPVTIVLARWDSIRARFLADRTTARIDLDPEFWEIDIRVMDLRETAQEAKARTIWIRLRIEAGKLTDEISNFEVAWQEALRTAEPLPPDLVLPTDGPLPTPLEIVEPPPTLEPDAEPALPPTPVAAGLAEVGVGIGVLGLLAVGGVAIASS